MTKNYVITSYIPNTHIDAGFVAALQNYCKINNAELHILQCKENYLGDNEEPLELAIREEFGDIIKQGSYKLNNHLHVSDFKISINTIDPLTGMESEVAKHGCMILPFPRHRFKTVPRMLKESKTPRAIWCTGTISTDDTYKNNKSGRRMKDYHKIGALFVQIENDKEFHIRQISYNGQGFYDLNMYYTGKTNSKKSPEALVLGDSHVPFQDPHVMKVTKDIINRLNIKAIVRHDDLDCCSISHHVSGKYLTKALINMTLEEELIMTSNNFKEFDNIKQYVVHSNHPAHLDRYIDEARYRDESQNHLIGLELALAKARGEYLYEYSMKKYNKFKNIHFLKSKDSYKLAGIEIADHGHAGSNGSKGNPKEKGITYSGKVVTGHAHTPEISVFGNFVTGTSTYLSLSYTDDAGSSSWLNSHVMIYPDGNMTHIHIIGDSNGIKKM